MRAAHASGRLLVSLVLMAAAASAQWQGDREVQVRPSPGQPGEVRLPAGDTVVDLDVWSTGAEAAVLVRGSEGRDRVLFWTPPAAQLEPAFELPAAFEARAIACHPVSRTVFVSGRFRQQFAILRYDGAGEAWRSQTIYSSSQELRRLLIGPRPFGTGYEPEQIAASQRYRLFFGVRAADDSFSLRSITEEGRREYQVLGPSVSYIRLPTPDPEEQPAENFVASALPAAFHPAGHVLIWQDARRCFHQIGYAEQNWGKPGPLWHGRFCEGSLTVTPNGVGLIQWRPGLPGVSIFLDEGKPELKQATQYTFASAPASVPDGKGIIGLVQKEEGMALVYAPTQMPLADVVNAWMFTQTPADRELLAQYSGLLRPAGAEQLYQLYDSEAYQCGGYTNAVPTRPYFVTTDIFWELWAAAYEGTFIVQERQQAIPAFWAFVGAARDALPLQSRWASALALVAQIRTPGAHPDPELRRILSAGGSAVSSVTGQQLDFGELKARGHYASDAELSAYFKAFRYLALISGSKPLDPAELATLPAEVKAKALAWIRPYRNYIAPARAPLAWDAAGFAPAAWMHHPGEGATIFPLSWGFDNEVLLSTVFHPTWPAPQQIAGPSGERLVPSGLDLAAALGSRFARVLLKDEIPKYPPLGTVLEELAARAREPVKNNLYDAWISALGVQWANEVALPALADPQLWQAKRLQSGLASWATLRHATAVVSKRTVTECNPSSPTGFEQIAMRPPRGYVEPDPNTFAVIANLFDALARSVQTSGDFTQGMAPVHEQDPGTPEPLRQGILHRLAQSASMARLFRTIAEKELGGQELSAAEYEEILHVGRVAEHHFLVYKSLANPDLALSNPDPMARTAEVAGGGSTPVLEAAVGEPLEWDQVVPFFGRREIVKGSVYSYYEFTSPQPLNDVEWRQKVASQARPTWIDSYVSPTKLSIPPRSPF